LFGLAGTRQEEANSRRRKQMAKKTLKKGKKLTKTTTMKLHGNKLPAIN
jgi:hypothetical protein